MAGRSVATYLLGMSSAPATLAAAPRGPEAAADAHLPRSAPARVGRAYVDVVAPRTWLATANMVVGMFVGILTFTVLVTLLATTLGLIPVLPLAVVTGALLLVQLEIARPLRAVPLPHPARPAHRPPAPARHRDGMVAAAEGGAAVRCHLEGDGPRAAPAAGRAC